MDTPTLTTLQERLSDLRDLHNAVVSITKKAFMAAPPAPGGQPPMDPSMMQGGPPMDPSMMQGGPPMDPSMMQGAPPMDPSMMQGAPPMGGPPMDPSMDPAAQQGGAPAEPDIMEQLLGAMEEMAAAIEQNGADIEALTQGAAEAESQRQQLEKKLSSIASTAPVGADWS